MEDIVKAVLMWSTPFLLLHGLWVAIAVNIKVGLAEVIMGLVGNALIATIFLAVVGEPVPFMELLQVEFAGVALALKLIRGEQ